MRYVLFGKTVCDGNGAIGRGLLRAAPRCRRPREQLGSRTAVSADPVVAKDTVNFELAKLYVKQGKKQEAADICFNIAKAASEAKDLDGKPVRMTETATNAKEKLKELDPERAKQIVDPTPESPFGNG